MVTGALGALGATILFLQLDRPSAVPLMSLIMSLTPPGVASPWRKIMPDVFLFQIHGHLGSAEAVAENGILGGKYLFFVSSRSVEMRGFSFLSLYKSVFIFQFLNVKMYDYGKQNIIVNFISPRELSFLSFEKSVFIFQFLNVKMYNYGKQTIIVNFIINKLKKNTIS